MEFMDTTTITTISACPSWHPMLSASGIWRHGMSGVDDFSFCADLVTFRRKPTVSEG